MNNPNSGYGEYTAEEYEAADLRPEHLTPRQQGQYTWEEIEAAYQRAQEERKPERWALDVGEGR